MTVECERCGEWFPFGPSDEAPVAVEVRAAGLSDEDGWQEANASEVHGWNARLDELIAEAEGASYVAEPCDEGGWHAGYLAHAIAHHDEEQAAGQALSDGGTTEGV